MFLVLQLPFTDIRRFLSVPTNLLLQPEWAISPEPGRHFVRSFGRIARRPRGSKNNWHSSHLFCRVKGLIKFDAKTEYAPSFQSFYSDGVGKSIYEFGFAFAPSQDLFDLQTLLKQTVAIRSRENSITTTRLIRISKHLAHRILDSSTSKRITPQLANSSKASEIFVPQDWWITPGRPLLLIDYDLHENLKVSRYAIPVQSEFLNDSNIKLAHAWLQCENTEIRTWLIGHDDGTDLDTLQRLRFYLSGVHSDMETLQDIVRLLSTQELSYVEGLECSKLMGNYIGTIASILQRKSRNGVKQSDILDVALEVDRMITEDDRTLVLSAVDRLRGINPNFLNNIKNVVGQLSDRQPAISAETILFNIKEINVTNQITSINGDNNVVNQWAQSTVTNSLNNLKDSSSQSEVKPKLEELHNEVEKILPKLPESKQKEVAQDLQTFTSEAISETPRKKWYELSAEGLIEAAQTVGELAEPIIKVVKMILGLISVGH
ncbi:MAG: hypothetical protein EKK48_07905 [Candidatus Melainabacteria bacterium]|nr:MAG: hypothetical protein EKK48_07905 [Candidatus Melainabacteria bacterium]